MHPQPILSVRKVKSIFLLLLIFTSQIGYYLVYAYQQYQVKETIKHQLVADIPEDSLELIVAEENDSFRWEEKGKEFYQDGELYDVVKSVTTSGKTVLYCINDKKEEELIHAFSKALRSGNNSGAKQKINFQISDSPVEPEGIILNARPASCIQYLFFDSPIFSFSKKVNAPPPRC